MRIAFKLECAQGWGSIVPHDGEDNGLALAKAAELLEAHYQEIKARRGYYVRHVAQIKMLAHDAYDFGASASIGHNRTDRYMTAATRLKKEAEALMAEAD